MVVPNPKAWLSDRKAAPDDDPLVSSSIGILAFETAATMTRLVSLHRSLSDAEILRLRSDSMRSQGVAYLTSTDQSLLLRLACAQVMDDLDRAAATIARLGRRCHAPVPLGFDRLYLDLKAGSTDLNRIGLRLAGKSVDRRIRRMEKYISATSKLSSEMEALDELEAAERRMEQKWGRHSGPIPMQKPSPTADSIRVELKAQHQKVRKLKDDSLWNRTFDKAVELMAVAACSVFARVCVVFGPFVPGLPPVIVSGGKNQEASRVSFLPARLKLRVYPRSGPLERAPAVKEVIIRNSCPILPTKESGPKVRASWTELLRPGASTVGGSGLALRYANVIVLSERIMATRSDGEEEGEEKEMNLREMEDAREELYEMLPERLRWAVRAKLRDCWRERGPLDGCLADGWRLAVWRILGWLAPVAHDTVQWQAERNMDRRQRFDSRPRTFMLQTLHFADREKTEAAIAEVLVGLSLVCWYDERRRGSLRYL